MAHQGALSLRDNRNFLGYLTMKLIFQFQTSLRRLLPMIIHDYKNYFSYYCSATEWKHENMQSRRSPLKSGQCFHCLLSFDTVVWHTTSDTKLSVGGDGNG